MDMKQLIKLYYTLYWNMYSCLKAINGFQIKIKVYHLNYTEEKLNTQGDI